MRTVLVTGGAGFIGHNLVKELASRKYRVIIIDNLSNSNKDFMKELETNASVKKNVILYKQDIRNNRTMNDIFKGETIDTCIHLAAKSNVKDSIIRPFETLDANVMGTLNILQMCVNYRIENFVFASSASVYGHPKGLPVSEDNVALPLSPYGASKVAAEALVSSYRGRLNNCKILRFFNAYGRGQTSSYAGVITRFIERLSKGLPPIIYGKGNETRDFIHISDIVQAIILAAESNQTTGDSINNPNIFNIGTGKPTTVFDLAHMLLEIFGLQGKILPIYSDPIAGQIIHSHADTKRTIEILNFSAKKDLRSGLMELVLRQQTSDALE